MTAPLTATNPSPTDPLTRLREAHNAEVRALRERIERLERALVEASDAAVPSAEQIEKARKSDADIAAVWNDDNASFDERVAARAFFRNDPADAPSRRWLLGDS